MDIIADRDSFALPLPLPDRLYGSGDHDFIAESVDKVRSYSPRLIKQLGDFYHQLDREGRINVHQDCLKVLSNWGYQDAVSDDKIYLGMIYRTIRYHHYFPEASNEIILGTPVVRPYNEHGDTIHLYYSLGIQEDQRVFLGYLERADGASLPDPVVVKWSTEIKSEIESWQKVQSLGVSTPHIFFDFFYWGTPALVMERLVPIEVPLDNEYKVGIAILKILRSLHSCMIHNDIKPDNIMKRPGSEDYFLIDFGGVATKRKRYGYLRSIYSPSWTSQVMASCQITTARNDFMELGYTMRWWQIERMKAANPRYEGYIEALGLTHREGFEGALKTYMKRIWEVDERRITAEDYDDLIAILSGGC